MYLKPTEFPLESGHCSLDRFGWDIRPLDQHEGLIVPLRTAAAKPPELFDHGLAEGGRPVPRIHRQAAHQLHQTFQSKLVPVRVAGFRDSVGIKQKEVAPLQLDRSLRVVGSPDQALDRIGEYVGAGVTLPIVMPIGNVDFALTSLAPSGRA